MNSVYRFANSFFLLSFSLIANNLQAEESLSAIMQRMKSESAVKIAYQETRTLELMDQPWYGSGYMYSISPELMIREQLQPQRLLMGVNADKMFYYDPENNIRHQAEMDKNDPLSLNIAVFQALINADDALLKSLYQLELVTKEQRWVMSLKAKQDSESGFSIVVSGLLEQSADTIVIRQADGDLSEFMLQQMAVGEQVKNTVTQLYAELVGE